MSQFRYILYFFIFLLFTYNLQAQDKIQLLKANELEGGTFGGVSIRKLKGDVAFRQNDVTVYCDSAYQYVKRNAIEAFGSVRIQQGDSVTITGRTLSYNGDSKNAILRGNVMFREKNTTLSTDVLEYNLSNKVATYTTGGVIRDQKNVLTSRYGQYESLKKIFHFRNNVRVTGPDQTFTSDTLDYNTRTKIAYFKGPTQMVDMNGITYSNGGEHNLATKETISAGKTRMESGSYELVGDQMYYDDINKRGVVKNNVRLFSKKDNIVIEGDMAYYWGNKGITKVFGRAIMKNAMADGDTLYLTADTLYSIDNNNPKLKRMYAYNKSRFFRADMQGKCDSLVYNFSDSTIYFFKDPVLWNAESQILADSININLANNKIHKMNLNVNSFIITQDSLKNFNQVKGKRMTAFFKDNKITRVNVDGNGESLYHALEGDSILMGLNKVLCSDMVIKFDTTNKVKDITFIKKPDARFIPPHEIQEPEKRLKGFMWRIKEKPSLKEVISRRQSKS